jgi:hypothetical protein
MPQQRVFHIFGHPLPLLVRSLLSLQMGRVKAPGPFTVADFVTPEFDLKYPDADWPYDGHVYIIALALTQAMKDE